MPALDASSQDAPDVPSFTVLSVDQLWPVDIFAGSWVNIDRPETALTDLFIPFQGWMLADRDASVLRAFDPACAIIDSVDDFNHAVSAEVQALAAGKHDIMVAHSVLMRPFMFQCARFGQSIGDFDSPDRLWMYSFGDCYLSVQRRGVTALHVDMAVRPYGVAIVPALIKFGECETRVKQYRDAYMIQVVMPKLLYALMPMSAFLRTLWSLMSYHCPRAALIDETIILRARLR
jgi:hypothetical protein